MAPKPPPIAITAESGHKWLAPSANIPYTINALPERSDRASPHPRQHSDAIRMAALAVYAETGNATIASDTVGIPRQTVNNWVNAEDTPELLDSLRSTIRYECGWQLASMVKRQMELTASAMERGNAHVMRDGRIIYVPASAKDQAISLSILIDKWMLVSGALSQSNALMAGVDKLSQQLASLGGMLTGGPAPSPPVPYPLSETPPGENLVG